MAKRSIDISNRDKEYTCKVSISNLPADEEQMSAVLSFLGFVKERKDTSVVICLQDEQYEEELPQEIMLADSPDGFYMELNYSMKEWNWEHPLLLANDHLTEEEAETVLRSILCDCTDDIPTISNGFGEISSRVYPEEEEDLSLPEKAILFALMAHEGVKRKGKNRPCILHPIEVMTIVAGMTDDEEVIAAAVLHDTIEDTGVKREDIAGEFGDKVADLVASESEDKRENLPAESTWLTRKQETIEHIQKAGHNVKLICLGDKLANLRELAQDYALLGDCLWERFNQKDKALHEWYYRSIYEALKAEFEEKKAIREYQQLLEEVFG